MIGAVVTRAGRAIVLGLAILSGMAGAARGVAAAAAAPMAGSGGGRGARVLIRRWGPLAGGLGLAVGAAGFLVAASGIVPIKVSSGHWPITRWLLEFSMQRSVSTHALFIEAPPLDDEALVLRGAGHYEIGCTPCHGSPEVRTPRIARQMTPRPPYLPPAIGHWQPRELFYIVKHGVKFTGMPAWPALERDDEVWAMVAFLQRLPSMSAAEYRRLAHGDAIEDGEVPMHRMLAADAAPPPQIGSCVPCHGRSGRGRGVGASPSIAGQRRAYLEASLRAYARGERHSGIMGPVATGLGETEIGAIAAYYGGLAGLTVAAGETDASAAAGRGAEIARRGLPAQRVPACLSCHGPGPRNPTYPILDGQYADYLALQLRLFKAGTRGGTPYAHVMRRVAHALTEAQIRDVAAYFAARLDGRLPGPRPDPGSATGEQGD
jgi:cytochrome c553